MSLPAQSSCQCGKVTFEARGTPIASVACYCDDCQEASRRLDALAPSAQLLHADGSTEYVLFRTDRVRCTSGASLLADHRLKPKSATRRLVASCCGTPMVMKFDDARHWMPMFRNRFAAPAPLQWRICTKFKPAAASVPTDVPAFPLYPMGFMVNLLTSRLAMLFSREPQVDL